MTAFADQLRQQSIEHMGAVADLLPGLNLATLKLQLESVATSLPADMPERLDLLNLIGQIPSNHGQSLVAAIAGTVLAKMYSLQADVIEYQTTKGLTPGTEAAKRRHAVNQEIINAAMKGFDGDWESLSELARRLAGGSRPASDAAA